MSEFEMIPYLVSAELVLVFLGGWVWGKIRPRNKRMGENIEA